MDYHIKLSQQAGKQLQELSERDKMPMSDVLEYLILTRYSISDAKDNAKRRRVAWDEYRLNHDWAYCAANPYKVYSAGYSAGWLHFQTRHQLAEDEKFIVEFGDIE